MVKKRKDGPRPHDPARTAIDLLARVLEESGVKVSRSLPERLTAFSRDLIPSTLLSMEAIADPDGTILMSITDPVSLPAVRRTGVESRLAPINANPRFREGEKWWARFTTTRSDDPSRGFSLMVMITLAPGPAHPQAPSPERYREKIQLVLGEIRLHWLDLKSVT